MRKVYRLYFDGGDSGTQTGNQQTGTQTAQTGTQTGNQQTGNQQTGNQQTGNQQQQRMYDQKAMDDALSTQKKTLEKEKREVVTQLELMREQAGLTETQKAELTERIETIQKTFQTEAERKTQEFTESQKKAEEKIKHLQKETDTWKGRFEDTLISTEIADAAVKHKAFSPKQIRAILAPITTVKETLVAGQPSGILAPQVKFKGKDAEGKDIELLLSIDDAVKQMSQMPEEYGNLFMSGQAGGLGLNSNGGSGRVMEITDKTSPAQYRASREKLLQQQGQR